MRLSEVFAPVQLNASTNLSLPSFALMVYFPLLLSLPVIFALTGDSTCTSPLVSALSAALSSGRNRTVTVFVRALCALPQYFGFACRTSLLLESNDLTRYGPEPTAVVFAS